MRTIRMRAIVPTLLALFALAAGCRTPGTALQRFEYSQPQMGVPFRIVLYAPDAALGERAAHAAFDRIRELNDRLSDYDSDSELSRLSQTSGSGRAIPVSNDLWLILSRSQRLAAESGGAFDVTVGPVVNLWRKARREKKFPRADLLTNALSRVGYQKMRLDARHHTVELLHPEMRLDLGAIAKGFAADEALKVLRSHGIDQALVTAAGDMAAGEAPPGKKGWRIELAPLDVTNAPASRFVIIARRGLATSGDLFQRVELEGVRYSHIVDPRTGIGLTDHSLVTVIARDGMTADGLSTTVSVLGPAKGIRLVEKTQGVEARVVRPSAGGVEAVESKGFADYDAKE